MNRSILRIAPALLAISFSSAMAANSGTNETTKPGATITVDELNRTTVIGSLGIPLNELMDMEGTIVATRADKGFEGFRLLVEKVGDKKLAKPVLIHFTSRTYGSEPMATEYDELFEIKNWKKSHSLNDNLMDELDKGYAGRKYRFRAAETGGYLGVPHGWSDRDGMSSQNTYGYARFITHLEVTAAWSVRMPLAWDSSVTIIPYSDETRSVIEVSLKNNNPNGLTLWRYASSDIELDGHPELKRLCVGKTVSFVELRDGRSDSQRDKTKPRKSLLCVYDEATHLRLGATEREVENE